MSDNPRRERYLTTRELAQAFDITPRHLLLLVQMGLLTPICPSPGPRQTHRFGRSNALDLGLILALDAAGIRYAGMAAYLPYPQYVPYTARSAAVTQAGPITVTVDAPAIRAEVDRRLARQRRR